MFGEVWPLISKSRRGRAYSIQLDGSYVDFWIPENVYIIGIMDTGEQSLQGLPTAIKRRFRPLVTTPLYQRLFKAYSSNDDEPSPDPLVAEKGRQSIRALHTLNRLLNQQPDCGPNVRLGHMYLSGSEKVIQPYTDQDLLADVWKYDILPQWQSFISETAATDLSEDMDLEDGLAEVGDFEEPMSHEDICDLVKSLAELAPADLPEKS